MPEQKLSIGEALAWACEALDNPKIINPKLNAEVLLCAVLGEDKAHLYLDRSRVLTAEELRAFKLNIERRVKCEPLQYITGKAGFMEKEFIVEPGVLIPRPETEIMVEYCLSYLYSQHLATNKPLNILDLCTGSGCIAISIADWLQEKNIPANIFATDISDNALQVAKKNSNKNKLGNSINFLQGDLCKPVEKKYPQLIGQLDLIVSNPPYVPTEVYKNLPLEVKNHEPKIALEAGADGMKYFYKIADFAVRALCHGSMLAIELYETQLNAAAEYLKTLTYDNIEIHTDLAGKQRFITARRR